MKTGNVGQAAVLSIAAVGALVFLVTRLMPPGHAATHTQAATTIESDSHGGQVSGLPTEILRDAFGHPMLTARYLKSIAKDGSSVPPTLPSGEIGGGSQTASDPHVETEQGAGQGSTSEQSAPKKSSKPRVNTVDDRNKGGEAGAKIELKAIMRATKSMALITIGKKPEQFFGLGDIVFDAYRIKAFSSDSVTLVDSKNKKNAFAIYVGMPVTEK